MVSKLDCSAAAAASSIRGRRTPVSWTPPVGWTEGALPCGTPPLSHPLTPTPQRPPSWDPFTPSDSRSSPGSDQLSNIDAASAPTSQQQVPTNHHQSFYNFEGGSSLALSSVGGSLLSPPSEMIMPPHAHPSPTGVPPGGLGANHGVLPSPPANRPCAACGGAIQDRYFLHAMDRYWHHSCLKCTLCATPLADIGSSCFFKNDMILCRNDYVRMFGSPGMCAACGQMIPASDYVMRAPSMRGGQVYHLKCFSCVKCNSQLVPGDRYNLVNGSLLCEQDSLKMLKASTGTGRGRGRKSQNNVPGGGQAIKV